MTTLRTAPDPFWMVACTEIDVNTGERLVRPPRYMHTSIESAEREAIRLAEKHNDEFVVLEAKAVVVVNDGVPRWKDLEPRKY